jgi:hypothetical protein
MFRWTAVQTQRPRVIKQADKIWNEPLVVGAGSHVARGLSLAFPKIIARTCAVGSLRQEDGEIWHLRPRRQIRRCGDLHFAQRHGDN